MASDLLPCPFCGGQPTVAAVPYTGTGTSGMESPYLKVGCEQCRFWFPLHDTESWEPGRGTFSIRSKAEEAIAREWNRRAKEKTDGE